MELLIVVCKESVVPDKSFPSFVSFELLKRTRIEDTEYGLKGLDQDFTK